jgi:dimethylhistidine N-methyltransferase
VPLPGSRRSTLALRTAPFRIERLPTTDPADDLADAVRRGLGARVKTLPPRFFYDAAGSQLFERICALPEYYLTRTEDAILAENAGTMVDGFACPPRIVELGSGSSTKTRRLIAATLARYGSATYLPIDVSETILEESARALATEFPELRIHAIAGDSRSALRRLRPKAAQDTLFVFLGSSLGNDEPDEAVALLTDLARAMGPRDRFLLGTDLDKDPARLEAAYDDAQGVTAQFNKNLLKRINRELGASFRPERFDHRAPYVPSLRRIEMHLVSRIAQRVDIPGAGLKVDFGAGESIHTENSHKYTVEDLTELARTAGFAEERSWLDSHGWFRVQRWRRQG